MRHLPMRASALLLAAWLWAAPAWADILCDGVDDILTSTASTGDLLTATTGTIMAWVFIAGDAVESGPCYEGNNIVADSGGYTVLARQDDNTFCAYTYDGTDHTISAASSAGWHHLTWRLGSGTLTLFVDGVSAGTPATGIGSIADTGDMVRVCDGWVTSSAVLDDRVTDVRYFSVALSDAEILASASSRFSLPLKTRPSAHWDLHTCTDGASANAVVFPDQAGNGWTLTGDDGANNTGLTCLASTYLSRPMGVQ